LATTRRHEQDQLSLSTESDFPVQNGKATLPDGDGHFSGRVLPAHDGVFDRQHVCVTATEATLVDGGGADRQRPGAGSRTSQTKIHKVQVATVSGDCQAPGVDISELFTQPTSITNAGPCVPTPARSASSHSSWQCPKTVSGTPSAPNGSSATGRARVSPRPTCSPDSERRSDGRVGQRSRVLARLEATGPVQIAIVVHEAGLA
jgi:hypothetical protein